VFAGNGKEVGVRVRLEVRWVSMSVGVRSDCSVKESFSPDIYLNNLESSA